MQIHTSLPSYDEFSGTTEHYDNEYTTNNNNNSTVTVPLDPLDPMNDDLPFPPKQLTNNMQLSMNLTMDRSASEPKPTNPTPASESAPATNTVAPVIGNTPLKHTKSQEVITSQSPNDESERRVCLIFQ